MTDTAEGLPVPQRYWAILTFALGLFMAVMDGAIANVALPTIARDLQASPAFSIWIVNGYQLAITISLLPLASLGEIIGYRRVIHPELSLELPIVDLRELSTIQQEERAGEEARARRPSSGTARHSGGRPARCRPSRGQRARRAGRRRW